MIISGGTPFPGQALAEETPMLSNGYFYSQDGLGLSGQFASYGQLYRRQLWVYVVCRKVGISAARLSVRVWDKGGDKGKVEAPSSPYANLLARPNPKLSAYGLWRWTVTTREIYGEAYWLKLRDKPVTGKVIGLYPMHPSKLAVKRDEDGDVWYIFTLGSWPGGILTVPEADVVPFVDYNPDNMMRGMSQLEPLRMTLLNEDAARRATQSFWQRGARPSVALVHPKTLSQPAQDRLRASWEARHAGADLMGGTAILEEGLEPKILSLNMEEMQYIESRKLNREEVCAAADIPPPVVHILDHATFSNITEQMRSMYRDTMSPRLEEYESAMRLHLGPEFGGDLDATFSLDEVLRGDFETRSAAVVPLVVNGVMKPKEARPLFDLDDAGDVADKLYANAAMTELGKPAEKVSITEPVKPDAAAASEAAGAASAGKAVTVRSIMGRLSQVKDGSLAATRSKLVDEHAKELGAFFDGQRAAIVAALGQKAAASFDPAAWNDDLSARLLALSTATAQALGSKTAKSLGGSYSVGDITPWLKKDAADSAHAINATTGEQLTAALDDADDDTDPEDAVGDLFDGEIAARASQISVSRVAAVGGLALLAAARQNDAESKTWVVTAGKPRASHAAMSGETVPLGELFSNGMNGPGDPSGGADEVAGCTCELDFGKATQ